MTEPRNSSQWFAGRVFKGAVWLFGSFALAKLGRLVMMLAIAALLSPQAYGIITLSTIILVVVQIINEFGIWQAVVHRSNPDQQYLGTAFTANILIGFMTTIGFFLIAPWIGGAYAEPEMTTVLRVMGLGLVLQAVAYVPDGLLRKELRFKDRVVPELAGTFTAAITTIALLMMGLGIISYAIGYVVESTIRCSLIIRIAVKKIQWRPNLLISPIYFKELFSYARPITGTAMIAFITSNIDFFVVGRVLGAGPLGFYALAFNLANYPVTNFASVLSKIAFPAFASVQEDVGYLRRIYLTMTQLLAAVVTPVLVVLALLAAPLIVEALGEEWRPAIFPLQAMVIAGISRATSVPGSDMLRAIGLPNVALKVGLVQGLVLLGVLLLIAHWGIAAVALAVALILSLGSWAITGITCRALGIGIRELGLTLAPGIALAASGAGAILVFRFLDLSFLSGVVELVVLLAAAGTAMAVCLATVCRSFFREVVAFVSSVMKSR